METNLNSWFHNQFAHQQLGYINSLNSPLNPGLLYDIPPLSNPSENIAWLKGTLNDKKAAYSPCEKAAYSPFGRQMNHIPPLSNPSENKAWLKGTLNDKKAAFRSEKNKTINIASPGSTPAQKRFLVFDQSGDRTTMFYTPAICPPVQLLPSEVPIPKPETVYHTDKILNRERFHTQDPIFTHPNNEIDRDETESEMHEDTEELNALLYSDGEYYEDAEEASTGHSPSTLTHFDRDCGEDIEEVASNFGPNKRIKLCLECEDDAGSSCGDGENLDLGAEKRLRREEIRETLSLLQKIIPCEKGINKDAILIFDEAIDYLKSLKEKALDLGVHTI